MITSKRKRIIFCGNYRWWYPRWNYLDGDNESISNQEFFGLDYMKKNIFQSSDSDKERIAKNRMKLNRVIDNSEYVVRCNQGKTSNPTSGFEYENCPSSKGNILDQDFGQKGYSLIRFWSKGHILN